MTRAKLFQIGRSQAVRLPRGFRFEGTEVGIARLDDIVILYPPCKEWAVMESGIEQFTPDYMKRRNQPKWNDRRRKL